MLRTKGGDQAWIRSLKYMRRGRLSVLPLEIVRKIDVLDVKYIYNDV